VVGRNLSHIKDKVTFYVMSLREQCGDTSTINGACVHKLNTAPFPSKCEIEVKTFSYRQRRDNSSTVLVNCFEDGHISRGKYYFVVTHNLRSAALFYSILIYRHTRYSATNCGEHAGAIYCGLALQ
jgi:hypothetical protein